jgi:hypothetical protein
MLNLVLCLGGRWRVMNFSGGGKVSGWKVLGKRKWEGI